MQQNKDSLEATLPTPLSPCHRVVYIQLHALTLTRLPQLRDHHSSTQTHRTNRRGEALQEVFHTPTVFSQRAELREGGVRSFVVVREARGFKVVEYVSQQRALHGLRKDVRVGGSILLRGDGGGDMDNPVVGVLERDRGEYPVPVALEASCIHSEHLRGAERQKRAGG